MAEPAPYGYCQSSPSWCADGEEPAPAPNRGNGRPPARSAAVVSAQAAVPREAPAAVARADSGATDPGCGDGRQAHRCARGGSGTEWGGRCDAYGHWNHYAVASALRSTVIVPSVPNYGRTCSGDPASGRSGLLLTPTPASSLGSFKRAFYAPPSAVPYDTYSARQYGFEVGGYFGWNEALASNCGTGAGIVEGEMVLRRGLLGAPGPRFLGRRRSVGGRAPLPGS